MDDKKVFTSIEDLLSASGEAATPRNQTDTNTAPDNNKKQGLGSIDEVLAAAEVERKKNRKNYKTFTSMQKSCVKKVSRHATPVRSDATSRTEFLDEFDYAVDAAEETIKALPQDKKAATDMAVNLLSKSQKSSRSDAEDLIHRAFKYIEG